MRVLVQNWFAVSPILPDFTPVAPTTTTRRMRVRVLVTVMGILVVATLVALTACVEGAPCLQGQKGDQGEPGLSASLNPLNVSIVPGAGRSLTLGSLLHPFANIFAQNVFAANIWGQLNATQRAFFLKGLTSLLGQPVYLDGGHVRTDGIGNVDIDLSLDVFGFAQFWSNVGISDQLSVSGMSLLQGGLTVDGGATSLDSGLIYTDNAGNLHVQELTVASALVVSNRLTVNAFVTSLDGGKIATDGQGNLAISGTLSVKYATVLNSTLLVKGVVTLNNVSVTGVASLFKGLAVSGGKTTLDGGLVATNGAGALTAASLNTGSGSITTSGSASCGHLAATSIGSGSGLIQTTGTISGGVLTCTTLTINGQAWDPGHATVSIAPNVDLGINIGTLTKRIGSLYVKDLVANFTVTATSAHISGNITGVDLFLIGDTLNAGIANIQTMGTLKAGATTVTTLTITGATIAGGSANFATTGAVNGGAATFVTLTLTGAAFAAGSAAISTTGTLSSGDATVNSLTSTTFTRTATLTITGATLAAGSANIATTGTLNAGAITATSVSAGSGSISTTGSVSGGAATFTSVTNNGAETLHGILTVNSPASSVSLDSGALLVRGGAAINGTLNVGTNLKVIGTINGGATTVPTLTITGATIAAGSANFATTGTIGGGVVTAATLTVTGATIAAGSAHLTTTGAINGGPATFSSVRAGSGTIQTTGSVLGGNATFSGDVLITSTTNTFQPTTGALVVAGSAGIGGTLNVAGESNIHGIATFFNSVQIDDFGPNALVVEGQAAFNADVAMGSSTQSFSTTTGALIISGGVGIFENLNVGGDVTITSSTVSGGTNTGALVVTGGVGIGGNTFVGGNLVVQATTVSTATNIGALVVAGGVGIGGDLNVAGNVNIQSALDVDGSLTTTFNTLDDGSGNAIVAATTVSTTTGTGALIVTGGVGIGGALHTGGAVTCTAVNAGSGTIQTTGSVSGGGATFTSVNSGSGTIQTTGSVSGGAATFTSVNANSGTIQTTGSVTGGAATFTSVTNTGAQTMHGNLVVQSSTASVSQNSGALQVRGGAAINGSVNIGTNLKVVGTSTTTHNTLDDGNGNVVISGTLNAPVTINTASATTSEILFESAGAGKATVGWSSSTGVSIQNGNGNKILQQITGGTTDTSLKTNHNTLDDSTGNMVINAANVSNPSCLTIARVGFSPSKRTRIIWQPTNLANSWEAGTDSTQLGLTDWYVLSASTSTIVLKATTAGVLSSKHNTLDDGSGNMVVINALSMNSQIADNTIQLFSGGTAATTYGFGVQSGQLVYSVANSGMHKFYMAGSGGTLLFSIAGTKVVTTAHSTLDDGNGNMVVTGSTASTTTGTGALVVTGGLGVGGAIFTGDQVSVTSSSAQPLTITSSSTANSHQVLVNIKSTLANTGLFLGYDTSHGVFLQDHSSNFLLSQGPTVATGKLQTFSGTVLDDGSGNMVVAAQMKSVSLDVTQTVTLASGAFNSRTLMSQDSTGRSSWVPVWSSTSPTHLCSSPAGTTSSTYVSMGCSSVLTFRPLSGTAAWVHVRAFVYATAASSTVGIQTYYGTGTAQTNGGSIVTGNINLIQIGSFVIPVANMPFVVEGELLITGLTTATTYWVDFGLQNTAGSGSSVLVNAELRFVEPV